jgi:hypothetical protein
MSGFEIGKGIGGDPPPTYPPPPEPPPDPPPEPPPDPPPEKIKGVKGITFSSTSSKNSLLMVT